MASPSAAPCDSTAPNTRPKFEAITPPSDSPLTPESEGASSDFDAGAVISFFKNPTIPHRRNIFRLSPTHCKQAREKLKRDPKLFDSLDDIRRLDYDLRSGIFWLRMPTPVHDYVATAIADEIKKLLDKAGERKTTDGAYAAKIRKVGSSRIFLGIEEEVGTLRRHPDGQFQHLKAKFPGLVIEISYSQDGKDLEKLAWDYIVESGGNIKAVIGIDINLDGKPSTVSLWPPEYTRDDGDERDMLGIRADIEYQPLYSPSHTQINSTQGQTLELTLSDFATDALTNDLSNTPLCIPFWKIAGEQAVANKASDNDDDYRPTQRRRRDES